MPVVPHDLLPPDPFDSDSFDPASLMPGLDDHLVAPVSETERKEILADLTDLGVYQALLEPRGFRGIVVDCVDCETPHYHDWRLLKASLEQLLDAGHMRPHEPAFNPDPAQYVSWDYCRGFADGVTTSEKAR